MAETTIREAIATLILRWDGDAMDFESERRAIIEVTNGVGELFLPRGPQGEKGIDGEPGPGLAPQLVLDYPTDGEAITHLPTGMSTGDRGYCVINEATKTAFFWSGSQWLTVLNSVGMQGPLGPSVAVSVGSVTTSPSGGSAAVSLDPTSTATQKIFNFTLPRGTQGAIGVGEKGEPGDSLSAAGDVEWPPGGPTNGQSLIWDDALGKAVWSTLQGSYGPFAAGPNQFTILNDGSWPQEYKQILRLTIPALPFAWHPRCYGYLDVKVNGVMARVDMEARLFSITGPCVGRGPGSTITGFLENYTPRVLIPTYEQAMTPESAAVTVSAGTPADVYVVLQRIDTAVTFGIQTRPDRSSFAVWCDPVRTLV